MSLLEEIFVLSLLEAARFEQIPTIESPPPKSEEEVRKEARIALLKHMKKG